MDDALKTRGIKYLNVETWLLFAPTIKMSGYAPAWHLFFSTFYTSGSEAEAAPPQGGVNKFLGGANPYMLYNIEKF